MGMFLRNYKRRKNGKWHEYFSVVENRRLAGGKRVQRTVLYRIPTADGRMLEMRRYSRPEIEHRIILDKLKIDLPAQPPPKVYSHQLNSKVCGGN